MNEHLCFTLKYVSTVKIITFLEAGMGIHGEGFMNVRFRWEESTMEDTAEFITEQVTRKKQTGKQDSRTTKTSTNGE